MLLMYKKVFLETDDVEICFVYEFYESKFAQVLNFLKFKHICVYIRNPDICDDTTMTSTYGAKKTCGTDNIRACADVTSNNSKTFRNVGWNRNFQLYTKIFYF